jgi:hypothetical protein
MIVTTTMKVIERWYEKLFGYDWLTNLKNRFSIFELILVVIGIVLIIDWLIRGDV